MQTTCVYLAIIVLAIGNQKHLFDSLCSWLQPTQWDLSLQLSMQNWIWPGCKDRDGLISNLEIVLLKHSASNYMIVHENSALPISMAVTILSNPGVIDSVPDAFMMNASRTEWITPGIMRMGHNYGTFFFIISSNINQVHVIYFLSTISWHNIQTVAFKV